MAVNHVTSRTDQSATAEQFAADGFVVIESAFDRSEIERLRSEAVHIYRGDRGAIDGLEPATQGESDDDVIRRYSCIHFPHKLSSPIYDTLTQPAVVDVLRTVIGPDIKAMQSMLFTKGEGRPGQAWHQDEYFIATRDRSLAAAWIALDDATVENGCLWVIPGSHRRGVIYPARDHDDPRFDHTVEAHGFPHRDDDAIPVELPAGAALIFSGYLLHRSLPNRSASGLRRALVNHYMSAQSLLPWGMSPAGVPIARWDYRDVVLVAGDDPYAARGTIDASVPHVRPDHH